MHKEDTILVNQGDSRKSKSQGEEVNLSLTFPSLLLSKMMAKEFESKFPLKYLLNNPWHHSYFIYDPRSFLTPNKKR